jgi:hypothetical protein
MISEAQIKEGVFVGPQLRQLIQGIKFEDQLSEVEKDAWKSFRNVTAIFLGEIIGQKIIMIWWLIMYNSTKPRGIKSLKVHFLDYHLDFFPENVGAVTDFTRKFPPRKINSKASGVPVCWLIIAGYLEGTFHRQNIAESQPLLLFR